MTENIRKNISRIVLAALILLTVSFIFTQSLLPSEVSSSESNGVKGLLATIFPPDTPLGAFISQYVRKIAHFVDFGLLGAELTLYALLFCRDKRRSLPAALLSAFFVAFVDETLQIFSGRGPMISDVWLDFCGSLCFSVAVSLVYLLVKHIKLRKAGHKNG